MKARELKAVRMALGALSAVQALLLLLLPLCCGVSYGASALKLMGQGAGGIILALLMLMSLAGCAAGAALAFLKTADNLVSRVNTASHTLTAVVLAVLSWLCVGNAPLIAGAFAVEKAAFGMGGYLLMLLDGLALALVLALRLERIAKRDDMPAGKSMLIRLLAIAAAVLVSMLMILMIGYDPLAVFRQIYVGSIGTPAALKITLERSIPLVLGTLAVIVAFRMHFWNVGVAGQLTMGAIFASFLAYNYASVLPHGVLLLLMFIAGAVGGALWGLLPAIAKIRWRTSETLFALMLNYVSTYLVQFLRRGPWEDPMMPSFGQCAMFNANARLSKVLGISSGWIAAVIILVLVAVYLRYTKQGFEITVVGEQSVTAQYVGVNVKKVILRTMLISGAIAGIAGMLKISGADFKLNETIAGDIGFSVITVAWLSKLNPIVGTVVALLFSAMNKGCESLSMSTTLRVNSVSIPSASATVIIGIILLFVLGCEFFISYRMVYRRVERKGGVKA